MSSVAKQKTLYVTPVADRSLTVCVVDPRAEDYAHLAEGAKDGVQIQFASTGSDALKLRRAARHSVWLVNFHLPDGCGCELAAAIRTRDPHSVVYLVSDAYDPADEVMARQVRGAMYVCKPPRGCQLPQPAWLSIEELVPRPLTRCA